MSSATAEFRQYCTFFLDDLMLGIDVMEVQEVIRYQEMTTVPLAPADFMGLINLRGQIVMAVDLRRRLGLVERSTDSRPINVVVRSATDAVSLLADRIGGVVDTTSLTLEPPPASLPVAVRSLIKGCYKLTGRLLLVIDAQAACNMTVEPEMVAHS